MELPSRPRCRSRDAQLLQLLQQLQLVSVTRRAPAPLPHCSSLSSEWLWPTGYFLRAYALLHKPPQFTAARFFILQRLAPLLTGKSSPPSLLL